MPPRQGGWVLKQTSALKLEHSTSNEVLGDIFHCTGTVVLVTYVHRSSLKCEESSKQTRAVTRSSCTSALKNLGYDSDYVNDTVDMAMTTTSMLDTASPSLTTSTHE